MAKQKYLAQFNKYNKMFITIMEWLPKDLRDLLNHEQYLYAEVELDDETEMLKGSYDDFKIVKIAEEPLKIYERTLNSLARDKIVKKYKMEQQLSIICDQLEKISERIGVNSEKIIEMNSYIQEVKQENNLRKEFYQNDPDYEYISTEDEKEFLAKVEDGGIYEYDARIRDISPSE